MMDGLHTAALFESVGRHQWFETSAASTFTVEYGSSGKVCLKHLLPIQLLAPLPTSLRHSLSLSSGLLFSLK